MSIMNGGRLACVAVSALALFAQGSNAHGGDMSKIQDGDAMSIEPIVCLWLCARHNAQMLINTMQDSILWIHILLQMFAFGILFPTGMVLGVGNKYGRPMCRRLMRCLDCTK